MTLFNRIKTDPELQALPEFVRLLLCRLSVSEVIAAAKFKQPPTDESGQEANVIKKISEKCIELQYSETHTDTLTSIFKEVVTIAKLIQAAWQLQSKDRLEKDVRREAAKLSRDITEGKVSIKEYASTLTGKMLESLKNPDDIDQLDRIAPLLQECFPSIDEEKLNRAMLKIIKEINLLKSFAVTVEIVTSPISNDIVSHKTVTEDMPQLIADATEDDNNFGFEIVGDSARQEGPGSMGLFGTPNTTTNAPQNASNRFCIIS